MRWMQQRELGRRLRSTSKPADERDSDAGRAPGDEDWLADVGDLNWLDTAEEQHVRESPGGFGERSRQAAGRLEPVLPASADQERAALVQRRRLIAALVLCVVLGTAIAVPLVLLRGGREATSSQPATTALQTATTTPAPAATPAPAPAKSTLTFELPASGTLRLGDDNPGAVTRLQKALARLGFSPGRIDGIFGSNTKAAVVEFQRSKGLETDGIVGKKTAAALNAALAEHAVSG